MSPCLCGAVLLPQELPRELVQSEASLQPSARVAGHFQL